MKIKALHLIIFSTIICFLCFSCKKNEIVDEEEEKPTEEEIGPLSTINNIAFESTKDASLIIINTKLKWTVSADASWISYTADNSDGKTGILIGAGENSGFPREGKLTISTGTLKHDIKITQGGAPIINISINSINVKMILVEAGTYSMGDGVNSTAHDVKVDSFYISETEVTNALWLSLKNSLPYDFITEYNGQNHREKPNQAVSAVSWNDVVNDFLPVLKTKTSMNFRLPTEAEWEYAALGGKKSKAYTYAGDNVLNEVGWNSENSSNLKKDIKLKKANELGLYDMSGNVSEWCSDWYGEYSAESANNPKGPETGINRTIRGGNYSSILFWGITDCACKRRAYGSPTAQFNFYGFRLAISI